MSWQPPCTSCWVPSELSVWKCSALCKQASFISSTREWRGSCFTVTPWLARPEGSREQATRNNWLQPSKGNYILEAGGLRRATLHQRKAAEVLEQGSKLQRVTEALLLPFTRQMRMTGLARGAGADWCIPQGGGLEGRGRQCLTGSVWSLNAQLYESTPF